ncbi:hypothetical protein ATER59S_01708 [Aquamicrobium terrae]
MLDGRSPMLRFLFRLAAMVALAVSVIMAVLDATRTVAASQLVMTPLKTSWNAVSPQTLGAAEAYVREKVQPVLWDTAVNWVLNQPGFAVFAVLAFLLYAIGYKPRRRAGRQAAA